MRVWRHLVMALLFTYSYLIQRKLWSWSLLKEGHVLYLTAFLWNITSFINSHIVTLTTCPEYFSLLILHDILSFVWWSNRKIIFFNSLYKWEPLHKFIIPCMYFLSTLTATYLRLIYSAQVGAPCRDVVALLGISIKCKSHSTSEPSTCFAIKAS
jgi:cbb3-type cytochrome oxidase subunit 1